MRYRNEGGVEDPCHRLQAPQPRQFAPLLVVGLAVFLVACAGSTAGIYYAISNVMDPSKESFETQMRFLEDSHLRGQISDQEQAAYMVALRMKLDQAFGLLGEVSRSDAATADDASRLLESLAIEAKRQLHETAASGRRGSEDAARAIEAVFGKD